MLLEGKKVLITGVLTPDSIAFAAARSAQEQGAVQCEDAKTGQSEPPSCRLVL
jgi:enoyl-[acyl-carrier-protein] reductase (NADH)